MQRFIVSTSYCNDRDGGATPVRHKCLRPIIYVNVLNKIALRMVYQTTYHTVII